MRWPLALALALLLAGCSSPPPPQEPLAPTGDDPQAPPPGAGSNTTALPPPAGNATSNRTVPASPSPRAVELAVSTVGQWPVDPAFDPSELSVPSGSMVTVVLTNDDLLPFNSHDWVLEGVDGAATDQVGQGESANLTFLAPPAGEYAYYCSVGDHRERGMEGTLTVA